MKKTVKRAAAAILSAVLMASVLAGCGSSTVNPADYGSTVIATMGDEKIYLDEANMYLRSDQYYYEMMYTYMYGTNDIWGMQVTNTSTMADNLRESVMSVLRQTRILCSHAEELGVSLSEEDMAKVEQSVTNSLEQSDANLLAAINLEHDRLVEIFAKNALANRVWEAMVASVDTNVSDEEARCVGASYVRVTEPVPAAGESRTAAEGETQGESQPEETRTAKMIAQEVYDAVRGGDSLLTAASAQGLTPSVATYFTGDTFAEGTLGAHALAMEEGAAQLFEIENDGWYVMVLTTKLDREATDAKKESIVTERRAEAFEAQYTQWQEAAPEFKVEEKIWKTVPLDAVFVIPEETTAAEETTGASEETTAAAGMETSSGEPAATDGETAGGSGETTAAR